MAEYMWPVDEFKHSKIFDFKHKSTSRYSKYSPPHENVAMERIHVPQKIKTIYHTKIIKVPEHHHYFHEKEKIVPEHHHYIHEKEKLVKFDDHQNDGIDYYNNKNDYQNEFQPSEFHPQEYHRKEPDNYEENDYTRQNPKNYQLDYQTKEQNYEQNEYSRHKQRHDPKSSHGYEIEESKSEDDEDPYYPPHPLHRDHSYPSASEPKPKRVAHRKRPPQRNVSKKHYKRKFH
ncbi:unnamed protein product [Brassicogethes aeneus]|uniref:Uncharacterized protein n=1 Tax=Brassicogethes aeneus TaxID=1431903 RepID=A0A9P0FB59_BRAAE|nr:unnamed protein product [Brassicogethes aeneus]